jgi:hypothetical protein
VTTYHRVATRDCYQVITRLGADNPVAVYGPFGPVQAVRGRETAAGFVYDPADVGPDLRTQVAGSAAGTALPAESPASNANPLAGTRATEGRRG